MFLFITISVHHLFSRSQCILNNQRLHVTKYYRAISILLQIQLVYVANYCFDIFLEELLKIKCRVPILHISSQLSLRSGKIDTKPFK